jgi:hypothetical protein
MNFLSHYYLHYDLNDPFFTVGLTAPDLISLMGNHSRVTEKFILNYPDPDPKALSFLAGMLIHIEIDQFFHRSDFFKKYTDVYQDEYQLFCGEILPHHLSHILLEIMIDRILLLNDHSLADGFYHLFRHFQFEDLIPIFSHLNHFDDKRFIIFTGKVRNSTFIKDYSDYHKIREILLRISRSTGLDLNPEVKHMEHFLEKCYQCIIQETAVLIEDIRGLNITRENTIARIQGENHHEKTGLGSVLS